MWYHGLVGGIVLGVATFLYLNMTGRITGISGIVNGVLLLEEGNIRWKASWAAGLATAAAIFAVAAVDDFFIPDPKFLDASALAYALGGFFVGFGTRFGNGCTSGHGVCGLSRLSPRSFIAVLVFMTSGIATATIFNLNEWILSKPDDQLLRNEPHKEVSYTVFAIAGAVLFAALFWKRQEGSMRDTVASFAMGLLFGVGLAVGGMTDRSKIIGFLTIDNRWDSQLIFVMGGGVLVAFLGFVWANRRSETWFGTPYQIPTRSDITVRLVIGAWLFGVGWGLTGLCPGPALMQVAAGFPLVALFFLPAMLLGMIAVPLVDKGMDLWQMDAKKSEKGEEEVPPASADSSAGLLTCLQRIPEEKRSAAVTSAHVGLSVEDLLTSLTQESSEPVQADS